MKKIIATVLCLTLVISLAACSSTKESVETTAGSSETTAESKETPSSDVSETVTSSAPDNAYGYIERKIEKAKMEDAEEYGYEDDDIEYIYPQLLIKSSYADSVNKEISQAVKKYAKALNSEDGDFFTFSDYAAFLTKEGVMSLIFISYGEYELNEFKVYNIDVNTGEKVDNAGIAKIAGVSDIRKAAMDALQKLYNDTLGVFKVENYKVVYEPGTSKDTQQRDVEMTFSERYLNDRMQIGLTDEGKMFFITVVDTTGGAEFYNYVFDIDGICLDEEEKAFVPVEDDDEEEEDDLFGEDDEIPDEDEEETEDEDQ